MLKTMKSSELIPNSDNVYESLINNSIGRGQSALECIQILNKIEGHYSIALDGQWGSGKTFLVNQIKMILDALNPHTQMDEEKRNGITDWIKNSFKTFEPDVIKPHVTVIFDAWENDSDQDPLLSILYCIENELQETVGSDCSVNLLSIVDTIADYMKPSILKYLVSITASLGRAVQHTATTSAIKTAHELKDNVHEFIEKLTNERGERLVLFIDELDRCKPDYAVKTLERIKHYLTHDRVTVVFSTNLEQLQHNVHNFYGQQFDAYAYLQRFFDLNMPIPSCDHNEFYKILKWNSPCECAYPHNERYYKICRAVIDDRKLSLRNITRFRELSVIAEEISFSNQSDYYGMPYILEFAYIVPIAIYLKVTNIDQYNRFTDGKAPEELQRVVLDHPELFRQLLENQDDKNDVHIFEQQCTQLYDAIFHHNFSSYDEEVDVGQLRITAASRTHIRQCLDVLEVCQIN